MKTTIVSYEKEGLQAKWVPTTISDLGKDERYLESVLITSPELLNLENRRTKIYGPLKLFSQIAFYTPQSRRIIPDIIFLTGSGDIVVVEVKLFTNPELRDRRVIAQAIDYASSLSALSEYEITQLFKQGDEEDFYAVVQTLFPEEADTEELTDVFLNNISKGNIHIIIACDKVPQGLLELAKSVSVQSTLNFSLDVVEITPFNSESKAEIMFVPSSRMSTEIVARTAISISYSPNESGPSVSVETTSLEEIEENLIVAKQGGNSSRRPPLSLAELNEIADENQVLEMFKVAVKEFSELFESSTRNRSGITFSGLHNGTKKSTISVFPRASSEDIGLVVGIVEDALLGKFGIEREIFVGVVGDQNKKAKSRVDDIVIGEYWNPIYAFDMVTLRGLIGLIRG